ncbi:MAG TPA: nuclease A inhibitor family protein, partial [Pyrinomonadaceae bacterium]|nr:nuclease A inhibitor family protein [Pyrinomonadaceae bacterium]
MKTDEQLISEMRQMIEGLLFMSESDYPFDVVRLEQRGEITPEKLREMSGEKVDAPVETRTLE